MSNIDTIWRASSFDNFVTNLPYIMLKAQNDMPPDMIKNLFTQRPWNPVQGDRVSFDAFSLPQYGERSHGENSSASLGSIGEGDQKTMQQVEYSKKFNYTHRMETFDKEKVANMFAQTVVTGINRIIEKEMTDKVLTYAENPTYTPKGQNNTVDWTCADLQPLASASHTAGGSTFSTTYTTACSLSTATLTDMEQTARQTHVNHLGETLDIDMDTLIIPKNNFMMKKAFEIFGTPKDPGTNLNAMNIYQTQWNKKIIVLNKGQLSHDCKTTLTTDTASYRFALMDSRYMENFQYQMSNSPTIQLKDTDIDTILKVILGISYCAFSTVQAQGYMLAYSSVSKPQITD